MGYLATLCSAGFSEFLWFGCDNTNVTRSLHEFKGETYMQMFNHQSHPGFCHVVKSDIFYVPYMMQMSETEYNNKGLMTVTRQR